MNNIMVIKQHIPTLTDDALDKVQQVEDIIAQAPQMELTTTHTIHDGVYTRTILLPAGYILTGVLLKVPTTLIINGDCLVYTGTNDDGLHIQGYQVFVGEAGRKQIFMAHEDTWLTMILSTQETNLEDIEKYFTDEYDKLASHRDTSKNILIVTGE